MSKVMVRFLLLWSAGCGDHSQPASDMAGRKVRMVFTVPKTLTANTFRHWSGVVCVSGIPGATASGPSSFQSRPTFTIQPARGTSRLSG